MPLGRWTRILPFFRFSHTDYGDALARFTGWLALQIIRLRMHHTRAKVELPVSSQAVPSCGFSKGYARHAPISYVARKFP
jgi:hypothetical protein